MVSKIAVLLFATILVAEAQFYSCTGRDKMLSLFGPVKQYCKPLPSELKDETWYQEDAVLKVVDGSFVVELLRNDSSPRSLIAEGKRVVELLKNFARIPSLERLSLEDNFIERIDGFVFKGLPRLVYLNLARNRIKYLKKDSFQGLNELEILNLNRNSLSLLSDSINDNVLPKLTRLYLQHNQLTDICWQAIGTRKQKFQSCHSKLEHLYLSNNSLRFFSPIRLDRLTHLFLEDNQISSFSIEDRALEVLSLDGNILRVIPAVTPGLRFLSLARNQIKRINNFTNARDLVGLVLSYNEITSHRGAGTFENLPNLEHLALDYNFLTEWMPHNFFHSLKSLRSLDLTGNKIGAHIHPDQFAHLPNLEKLYLGSNRLVSFPGNESCRESKLGHLDLSNNTIEDISDLGVNMIPELKVLRLTGNRLRRIDAYSIPANLTILL